MVGNQQSGFGTDGVVHPQFMSISISVSISVVLSSHVWRMNGLRLCLWQQVLCSVTTGALSNHFPLLPFLGPL